MAFLPLNLRYSHQHPVSILCASNPCPHMFNYEGL
jgi:hypothetical protein